jgi:hypothetical protein
MKHSRPGFATRYNDHAPAKLNDDMIPAINRKPLDANSNLKEGSLDARTAAAMAKLAAKLAAEHTAPNILVNPTPSDPPKVLEPGK